MGGGFNPPQGIQGAARTIFLGSFTVLQIVGSIPSDNIKGKLIYLTQGSRAYLNLG